MVAGLQGVGGLGNRTGWGSEVRGVGEQGQRGAGQLGTKQFQERYSIYSEARGGRRVGVDLDSLSD